MVAKGSPSKDVDVEVVKVTLEFQKDIIDEFLERMENAARRASTRGRTVTKKKGREMLAQQTNYWKNVNSGIKWMRELNQQRRK